nr:phosphatidylglycerol lysyltransferase domain-containing protein [Clostridium aciditolerans]
MDFKKLTLEDKQLFNKYLNPYKFLSCEYSFTTLYIWKDACDIQYAIYKESLIIKKKDFEGNYYFMQPLGYKEEDLKELLKCLSQYQKENNMKYIFKDLEEDFAEKIRSFYKEEQNVYIKEDRDNFDYLYEADKLIKLSGKKLHGKKNHYNSFVKNYDYEVKEIIDGKITDDVINAAEKWFRENNNNDKMLYYETAAIKEIVQNINLFNLKGIAVYVDNQVVAFSLGEKLNDKLAVIHIEKGDMNYRGVYSFINKTFIDMCFSDVKIINREQDLGIEGLRKAKLSYYPFKLEKKFILSY